MQQQWKYHQNLPSSGKRLLLLSRNEVLNYNNFLSREFGKYAEQNGKSNDILNTNKTVEITLLSSSLSECISDVTDNELLTLNNAINECFTDHGWREVRRRLSQYKKRAKQSHIVVSKTLKVRLTEYQLQNKFDSIEQVIDTLLTDEESKQKYTHDT